MFSLYVNLSNSSVRFDNCLAKAHQLSVLSTSFDVYDIRQHYVHILFFSSFRILYTTQNLLRITFSFNDLMLKTNRLKKDFFYKDRLTFGLDDPVANMSIWHVYYA